MTPDLPMISFVIPVRSGTNGTVAERSIARLKYPKNLLEVLVVEGGNPSAQRNLAADRAQGDIIYFIDDDTELETRALTSLVDAFDDHPDCSGMGGPAVPHAGGRPVQQAIKAVLQSVYGSGPMRVRYFPLGELRETDERELILCNFAIRRSEWQRHRPFCEQLYPNEENEFFNRMRASGAKLLYHPFLVAHRQLTVSTRGFVRQMFRYGFSRVRHMKFFANAGHLAVLVPLLGMIYFAFFSVFQLPDVLMNFSDALRYGKSRTATVISVLPIFAYFSVILIGILYTLCVTKRRSWHLVVSLFLVLPACHLAYGLGMLVSVVTPTRLRPAGPIRILRRYSPTGLSDPHFRVDTNTNPAAVMPEVTGQTSLQ